MEDQQSAREKLAAYRERHVIRIAIAKTPYASSAVCLHDGIVVRRTPAGLWRHDHDEVHDLAHDPRWP